MKRLFIVFALLFSIGCASTQTANRGPNPSETVGDAVVDVISAGLEFGEWFFWPADTPEF